MELLKTHIFISIIDCIFNGIDSQVLDEIFKTTTHIDKLKSLIQEKYKDSLDDLTFSETIKDEKKWEYLFEQTEKLTETFTKLLSSETEEEFFEICREFLNIAQKSEIKELHFNLSEEEKESGKEQHFLIWTNHGLTTPKSKRTLLEDLEYKNYYPDMKILAIQLLWKCMEDILVLKKIELPTEFKKGEFFIFLEKKYTEEKHIVYDRLFSKLFMEYIPNEELSKLRIEFGQNLPYGCKKPFINTGNIMANIEFPVFLQRVAVFNALEPDESRKIKITDDAISRDYEMNLIFMTPSSNNPEISIRTDIPLPYLVLLAEEVVKYRVD